MKKQPRNQTPTSFRFDYEIIEVIDRVHALTGYPKSNFVSEAILQYAQPFCEIHARRRIDAAKLVKSLEHKK